MARTPELLPILRRAGVVDAGGEGFRVVLEGLLRGLRGENVEGPIEAIHARADLAPSTRMPTISSVIARKYCYRARSSTRAVCGSG